MRRPCNVLTQLFLPGRQISVTSLWVRNCRSPVCAAQVCAAEGLELSARGKFEVFAPVGKGAPSKAVADSRRALRWEMADG